MLYGLVKQKAGIVLLRIVSLWLKIKWAAERTEVEQDEQLQILKVTKISVISLLTIIYNILLLTPWWLGLK